LSQNANPNATSSLGWRPIHFAAKRGHVATVDMLVQQGAEIDVYTKQDATPLMLAEQSRMWDTVRKLKQFGATDEDRSDASPMLSTRENGPAKRRKKNFTTSESKTTCGPISHFDISPKHSSKLIIKYLQYQNHPYDVDLSRKKLEFTCQMLNLPLPFTSRHNSQFYKNLKKLTAANLNHNIRINAAVELMGILKSAASMSKRSGAANTKSNSCRSLESCLRTLEFSVCEKHCSNELISLIADITSGLIILFDHSDDTNAALITYVSRLIQWMCRNNSSQFRSGILALIASILSKNPPTTHISSKLAVPLISNLISLTDSLNQVEAVSRLVDVAVLIGDYNPREFGKRFNDLVDILIGWCVDSSDAHHSISQSSILNQICLNFSKWWFCESSSEVPSFKVSQSTCSMLSHLIEDADNAFREALTEHYQLASVKLGRHSGRSLPQKDTTQRLVAAKLFFSVLAGVCSSMLKYANESTPPGHIDLIFLDQPEWHNRLLSILQTLDMLHSLNTFKPPTSSRSHIPLAYSIPLLIYGEIVRCIHEILLFTNSTVPLEQDYIGLHIESYLILPLGNYIVQPSSQHAKILCELALSHLKRIAKCGHTEVLRAIRIFFKSNTFLQRLKVSKCGSAELVNLLLGLVRDCDLLDPVIDMCLSDFKSVCSKLSSGSFTNFDELCSLFTISLFSALWKACFGQPKSEPILKKAVSRLRNILTEIHMSENIPLRIRLAFWSLVLQFRDLELSTEVVAIAEELARTATINLHELILLNHALKMVDSTLDTNISQALSSYLLRLMQNPCSPVRANCGADFCEAVGHLIRLWKNRKPNEAIFKLIYMCLSHPFPRIQSRGADLLLIFGRSLRYLRSPLTKNALFHWYSDTDVCQSTALVTNAFMGQLDLESSEEVVSVCGAFPSVSGTSGVFNIITRGVPPSDNDLTRFNVLEHSNDYLRRLACLISPIPTYSCKANWFAEDIPSLSIISHFTSAAIMDNKLNVAPWTDPISTFLSIEGIVHAVLANLTERIRDYPYAKDLKAFFDIPVDLLSYQTPSWLLNHGGKLLTFMRSIEKSMMNGVDGYAAAMLPSPIRTHIFLRANAVTCRKWFNRIRIPLASLASWISGVSLQGVECPATVVWNIYSILYQTVSTNPQDFFNAHKFVDNPEKIMLLLIQALHQLKAVDELELVHYFLEGLPLSAPTSDLHIFSWIRGLVQILRGNLDEGIAFLFHFFEVFSTPLPNSFGALSYHFACRTFTNLLLRIGGCTETQSDTKKADVVDDQGDAPPVISRRRTLFKKDVEVSEQFLFRQPDVARRRIKALEKLSSWDNSMPEISKPAEALASFITDQEDRLLTRASNFLSEVTLVTRSHAAAVIPLIDLGNCSLESSISSLHLDAESTLQTLAAEADLLVAKSLTPCPPIIDLDLGTWSLLTKKDISPSVFLDACEPLLLPPNGGINRLPVDNARGVASRLLKHRFRAMGIKDDLYDFANLITSIKSREDLGPDDKLRFIRYVANLLWTASDTRTNRIAAMKCLSEGLLYSITSESIIKKEEEELCQLNVSVALQLFECLGYPSSIQTSSTEIRNLCHEVVDLITNEQASIATYYSR
uniref:ANK_REP_REGION domain-containing protein n=1 Tax=Rodentolepis nana TaxID=102285 RepID=A0A0R3T9J9_RODNA